MKDEGEKMKTNNNRKEKSKKDDKRSKKMIIILTIGVVVFIPLLILYINDFNFSDYVNFKTIGTSNMGVSEAEDINQDNKADIDEDIVEAAILDEIEKKAAFEAKVKAYQLTIVGRNGISEIISGEEINLHTASAEYISEYDDLLLKDIIKNLNFFDEANTVEPINASISEYRENGYEILSENSGAKINEDKLYEAIQKAIINLEPSLSLEEENCYFEPEIKATSPEIINALNEMNRIVNANITYEIGEDIEVLDSSQIRNWISVDDNLKVQIDTNGIKEYVDYIGKTYNSFGRTRKFKTSYEEVIEIKGGDYGWWLDRPAEVSELAELLMKGERLVKKLVYRQIAQQYGQDDIGDTYVEVNLTAQHLFFYKEGELIVETDFVSGNLSKKYGTPTGTYPVQYKDRDATLRGEDYATPVEYWMPFNGDIGFHDAYWRDEFGKDIYFTDGSHGCINMPPAAAKKMFKHIQRGVAVLVYELEGTESFEIEENIDEPSATDKNTN